LIGMYAVIRAGGKQFKVAEGDIIEVERIGRASGGLDFKPLLVVDDAGETRVGRAALGRATVRAEVLGETKGAKVDVVKYRSKTGYRRHTGHRQRYTSLRIAGIDLGTSSSRGASKNQEVEGDGS
jgi:large subunit ribosomal protein L21